MATNIALKRARKAQRRKQVVAQKRRAEVLEASLPARVLRAAQAPIQHCLLTESVFDIGMGTLILARGATRHHLALSSFLIDVFCLGIKDVMFESVDNEVFEMYMEATDAGSPMISVDPSYARKLLLPRGRNRSVSRRTATSQRWSGYSATPARTQAMRSFGSDATASRSIFPARTTPLPSFNGGSRSCGSISAMTVSVSRWRPEADPVPSPVRRSTRISFSVYWLLRFSEVMLQCQRST
jgi:hypothetical protein